MLGAESLDILGHHIDSNGVKPLSEKVQAVRDFPQPQTPRQLREFVGMVNFYHRFVPHCAELMQPLYSLLKQTSQTLSWTETALTSFQATKDALAQATLLSYPMPDAPTCVATDASNVAVGAVLQQYIGDTWQPISFFSKGLRPPETRYSTFDRELLAIYLAIKHFRHFLEGRQFHILTDHKPLTFALNARPDRHSPRQARQLDFIAQFTSVIRHVQGSDNVVADALSRIETNALITGQPPVIDFQAMAKAQKEDPQTRALQSSPHTALNVQAIPLQNSTDTILCDTSTGTYRPLVPSSWRRVVFNSLHNLSHPGIRATQRLVTSRFVWPSVKADVRRWTRSCTLCQRSKVQQHSVAPLTPFPMPKLRFDTVHIDLVGPLPPSQGFTYLLTCIDRFTRWPEAIPLSAITAEAVAQAFIRGWISRFGVPATIVTDRGQQFESRLWSNLTSLLGVKRSRTTAYHPQSNGMIEHFHRQLKASLKTHQNSTWMSSLPLVLLGIRTALKEDMKCTVAEMVYGTSLRLPGEFFISSPTAALPDSSDYVSRLKQLMQQVRPPPPRQSTRESHVSGTLDTCTHVFVRYDGVRKPLQPPYDGPYSVLERQPKYFTLDINGQRKTVSVDRLKPAHLDLAPSTLPNTAASQQSTTQIPSPASAAAAASTPRVTRSGRHVHWPRHLTSYVP